MEKELTTYMENEHKRNSLFSQQATEASSIDIPPSISVPHSLSSSIQFLSSYHPSVQSKQLFPFSHRSKPSLVNSVQFSRCFTHRSLQSHFANLIKAH
ncbi:hypothetical protein P8452_42520 [Trifolium repens]|nr:hypothetical protein P8452_42520 [Trifolium repens]